MHVPILGAVVALTAKVVLGVVAVAGTAVTDVVAVVTSVIR